jgi:hypothetical protein
VTAAFPGDEPLLRPLRAWTDWAVAYRYPDEPSPPPEPSAEELAAALEQITRVANALEARVRTTAGG